MDKIGITEMNDPVFDESWIKWGMEKYKPLILITKNLPAILQRYPKIYLQQNIIIHATITGYGGTFIEPNVPHPQIILNTLKDIDYKDRIVIRIDPIIPTKECIKQSQQIYEFCKNLGYKRFKISVLDLYEHVVKRLDKYHDFIFQLKKIYNWDMSMTPYKIHAPFHIRKEIMDLFSDAEVCCEPYDQNITPNAWNNVGCVSRKDLELFGIKPEKRYNKCEQREFCGCLGIKKQVLTSGTCEHGCVYCYCRNN